MAVIYEKRLLRLQQEVDDLVECNHKMLDMIKALEDRVLELEFAEAEVTRARI